MATTPKKSTKKKAPRPKAAPVTEAQFAVILEDLRSKFAVFGEALQGMRESMDQRFERVEGEIGEMKGEIGEMKGEIGEMKGEIGLLKDAVRTHSKELQRLEAKLDRQFLDHERRITKLEGAAE